ncbi:MAG TPA: AAA family ATPase [Caulobacteraceae bacterium]|jgi:dephospho-CoA kinase
MGVRNYLIEGVSGTGKTSVCNELRRRGYHAINGDRELSYQGDPETGERVKDSGHEHDIWFVHRHHIWDVDKIKSLVADQRYPISFFCGGSRNFHRFIDLFDEIFVLDVDLDTLNKRLAARPGSEWGGRASERELIARLHATREDVPQNAMSIDATAPIARVVDDILSKCGMDDQGVRSQAP